jgi:large subunit ribosomal protein L17
LGDNAEMCIIELVDYNEAMLAAKEAPTKQAKAEATVVEAIEEVAAEIPVVDLAPVADEQSEVAPAAEETNKKEE